MQKMALAALLTLAIAADAAAQAPRADAYVDDAAGELVRAARARRNLVDRRIERYRADVLERISVRLRAGIGERLLFRRETASHIDWTLDTVRVEVLGAREVVPAFKGAPQIPAGLSSYMPSLAFDPVQSEMLLRLDSTSVHHPLAEGSEDHYRFRTGDSTVIRLPTGRVVRLRELQVLARRRDPTLITGSFWLDMDTHAVVQAYFRLARGYDADQDEDSDAPPFLKPLRAELDYFAIDYGLWDLRWWLPRSVAAHGLFQAGPLRMPLSFERRYDDYEVTGDTVALPPAAGADLMAERPCRPRMSFTIQIGTQQRDTLRDASEAARADSIGRAERTPPGAEEAQADSAQKCDRAFIVTQRPHDELLAAPELPEGGIYAESTLLDEDVLRRIAERVGAIPTPPWQLGAPSLQTPLSGPGLLRYNRVEGLSAGVRALMDFGGAAADAQLQLATAIPDAFAEAGLTRSGRKLHSRLAAYRRLEAVDVGARPLTFGSSLAAVLLGRDDNDYFRASGLELRIAPPETRSQWVDLRLFAEAQRTVGVNSEFSIAHVLDNDRDFRPNIAATRAEQAGAELRLRVGRGFDPESFRWASELELHAEAGDYEFLRPSLRMRASTPLFRGLVLAVEGGGGTAFGTVPVQRLWHIGGSATLRGYDAGIIRGDSYWRTRVELGAGLPFARLAFFGDAGWAGARGEVERSRPLRSAGIGLSFLDGLVRFDLARALDAPRDWKLHMVVGGF